MPAIDCLKPRVAAESPAVGVVIASCDMLPWALSTAVLPGAGWCEHAPSRSNPRIVANAFIHRLPLPFNSGRRGAADRFRH